MSTVADEPLRLACAVLEHQGRRAADATVRAAAALAAPHAEQNRVTGCYPLLELHAVADAVADAVAAELPRAVATVTAGGAAPGPLVESGRTLAALGAPARREQVGAWLDDVSLLDPRAAFWVGVAAGPILETAASAVALPERSEWTGPPAPPAAVGRRSR